MDNKDQKHTDGKSRKSEVEIKYEQIFSQLVEGLEPDDKVRNEVFNTLSMIEDLAEVIDLFTGKFAQSQVDLIKGDKSL
ncbi:MAG: hypothetical protein HKN87_22855 [Saprospiraceae bacterium]|nr:hypothetical protein [Saprospiraceae bacterium]